MISLWLVWKVGNFLGKLQFQSSLHNTGGQKKEAKN